jgi:F-type H+-transporting ATPase subunit epsilon
MAELELAILTPDRTVFRGPVDSVQVPGAQGSFGVLPRHAPLLAELGCGELVYRAEGQRHAVAVAGGLAEVLEGRVVVLADAAEASTSIDVARAQAALDRAQDRLRAPLLSGIDTGRARRALLRARNRLHVAAGRG